jgi:hypothetical protein
MEQVPADGGGAPVPVEQRLAAVEHRLDALEGSIRDAVTQEIQAAGEEMRRAVSELGRLLLRDLDRLTKVLAEHRDAIVERLSAMSTSATSAAAPPAAPPSVPTAPTAPSGSAGPADAVAAHPPADEGGGGEGEAAEPAAMSGEDGRWWALPGRRRHRRG